MKRIFLMAVAAAALMSTPALANDLTVTIDQTKMVQLSAQASTIVVGNPSIADVSMQDGDTALVTGKSFGTTNIIAIDGEGRQVANVRVVVAANSDRTVTLMRGNQQVTLSCAPRCAPAPVPGDAADTFSSVMDQAKAKAGLGSGSAKAGDEGG
jgi:hypothetical protein